MIDGSPDAVQHAPSEAQSDDRAMGEPSRLPCGFVPQDFFKRYNVTEIFGHGTECEVDLGCGDGGFLLQIARQYPERLYLGVERLLSRLRKLCGRADKLALANVRGLRAESSYFLEWMIQPGSIRRIHYLFPDPWPKFKHHKNRLIRPDTVPIFHRALARDGELLFRTDHEDYFTWVREHLIASELFRQAPWDDLPTYPTTDFQRLWESQGRPVLSARFIRIS